MAFLHVFQLLGHFNKAFIAFVKVLLLLNVHVLPNIWGIGNGYSVKANNLLLTCICYNFVQHQRQIQLKL